jgi:putative nucleotidyltransferase with HDIG domain
MSKRCEWTLLVLRLPGQSPKPAGILLLDPTADRLYVRLRDDLLGIDEDVAQVFEELGPDLEQLSQDMGGENLLRLLEDQASLTFQVEDRQEIQMASVEETLADLFHLHVCSAISRPRLISFGGQNPVFSHEEIRAARETLPISRVVGLQILKAMQSPTSSLADIERLVRKDPALTAHLIKLANVGLRSYRPVAKSIPQALVQVGFDQARLHIWGVCMRRLYTTPHLQRIWNHSLETVEIARELCKMAGIVQSDEASLAALVHDIGQIALAALGERFENRYRQLHNEGLYPVGIEQLLCGITHAEIGADLLSDWHFSADLVEAVRCHHSPSNSSSVLTSLLYIAESWADSGEDVYAMAEHTHALNRLRLDPANFVINKRSDLNLGLLRFAA